MKRTVAAAITCAFLTVGCAPDSVRNSSPFNAWITQLQQQCQYQAIGVANVGALLGADSAFPNDQFLDVTSRLYFGRISQAQWVETTTASLNGRPTDPGIKCVLDRLPPR
jgi:hypothetical protein